VGEQHYDHHKRLATKIQRQVNRLLGYKVRWSQSRIDQLLEYRMRDMLTRETQTRVASSCYMSTILSRGEEEQQMAKGKTIATRSRFCWTGKIPTLIVCLERPDYVPPYGVLLSRQCGGWAHEIHMSGEPRSFAEGN
jgi:hypothetical protein